MGEWEGLEVGAAGGGGGGAEVCGVGVVGAEHGLATLATLDLFVIHGCGVWGWG